MRRRLRGSNEEACCQGPRGRASSSGMGVQLHRWEQSSFTDKHSWTRDIQARLLQIYGVDVSPHHGVT